MGTQIDFAYLGGLGCQDGIDFIKTFPSLSNIAKNAKQPIYFQSVCAMHQKKFFCWRLKIWGSSIATENHI